MKLIEFLSWIPYTIKNKYFYDRDELVRVSFPNIDFLFKIIQDKDYKSLSRNLQSYRMREPRYVSEFINFVEKNDIVLDVGANIGFFTILSKKAKKIISIEPVERCIPILKENIKLNYMNNVKVLKLALGDGKDLFIKEEDSVNLSKIVKDKEDNAKIVESKTIRYFVDKYNINFIKMDIEGYEYEILGNAKIPKGITKIAMEFHTGVMGEEKSKGILDNLYNQGFYVNKLIEDFPLRLYPFMRLLWKRMTYVKEDLRLDEAKEEIFKGRSLKYLYLKR